ncbi:hypothetical protein G6F62_013254 [Rhizopus arrhizus]|nr:hypothetical protein G6F62_013254 [Rhizopus arrhizus]
MQRGVQRVAQHQYALGAVQIELRTCKPVLVGVPHRATAAAAGQGATRTIDRQPHQVTAAVLAMGFSPQRTEPATGRIKAVHRHRFIDHAHRCACDQFRIAIEVDVLQPPPRVAVRIRRAGQRLALARRRKLNRDVAVLLRIGVRQLTSPTPGALASCTGAVCTPALALAIAAACCAALATSAVPSALVAAKPQAPLTITRTPTPDDSRLVTLPTWCSRVMTDWLR